MTKEFGVTVQNFSCLVCVVKKGRRETFKSLVHEFRDVFPSDLPLGLPLVKGIEHVIDLVPVASLPN